MGDEGLILPWLSETLESAKHQEEINRSRSSLYINAIDSVKDNLEIIEDCLGLIFELAVSHEGRTDDEETLQVIGIRLFNTTLAALKLILAGYYLSAFALMRDVFEAGSLLDYLTIFPEKIHEWRAADKESHRAFKPSVIGKALDERDDVPDSSRREQYEALCYYAVHPSFEGYKLYSKGGTVQPGPFVDERLLKSTIQELTKRFVPATISFTIHLKELPPELNMYILQFVEKTNAWRRKYLQQG